MEQVLTRPKITVIGRTVLDITVRVPRRLLHHLVKMYTLELPFGSKLPADGYLFNPGGSGANVAVGLTKLGVDTTLESAVSNDHFGILLEQELTKKIDHLELDHFSQPTPISIILSVEAEQTIINTNSEQENNLRRPLPKEGHLHIGPLIGEKTNEFYQKLVSHIISTDQTLSINPSMDSIEQRDRAFLALLRAATIVIVNQEEGARLARLAPKTEPEEVINQLKHLTQGVVCVTCGERGAFVSSFDDRRTWFAKAATPKSERVNATGAGDAFTSAFIACYLGAGRQEAEGERIQTALRWAILNSGSVAANGHAQDGLLTVEKIEKDLRTVHVTIR